MSHSNSDTMSPPTETNGAGKRRADDGAPQPRAKRNRYISIAWYVASFSQLALKVERADESCSNECKRRKIKCNGQTPCQRCGNLSLECNYAPNCCNNFKESEYVVIRVDTRNIALTELGSEFKQMSAHIGDLQQQVDSLVANMNQLKHQVEMQAVNSNPLGPPMGSQPYSRSMSIGHSTMIGPSPTHMRSGSSSKHPRFHGPTSNTFNVGVAKSSLKTMGITGPEDVEDEGMMTQDATPMGSPGPAANTALPKAVLHPDKDPIWSITKHEALRLVHLWQEEMGMMYPFLDIDKVVRHAERLFTFTEAAARAGLMQGLLHGADAIEDDQTNILKMMLAIALTLEGTGKDPLGERLYNNVLRKVQMALSAPVELKNIQLLTTSVSTD
jgi:hypothetical protein